MRAEQACGADGWKLVAPFRTTCQQAEVAPQLLGDVLALLAPLSTGGYLAPRCANLALQFVTAAVDEKEAYKALKPHLDGLMIHVVLPMLAFDDADSELWVDDPSEFVRKVRPRGLRQRALHGTQSHALLVGQRCQSLAPCGLSKAH